MPPALDNADPRFPLAKRGTSEADPVFGPLTLNRLARTRRASEWNPDYGYNVIFPAIEFIRSAWAIAHIITGHNAAAVESLARRVFGLVGITILKVNSMFLERLKN